MIRLSRSLYALALLTLTVGVASAQVPTGVPPFSSVTGGPDVIDLANLNSHIDVPVFAKAGRGRFDFTYDLSYDSSVWYPVTSGSTTTWTPVVNWGWRGITEVSTGYVSNTETITMVGQCHVTTLSNWAYHDALGAAHPFSGSALHVTGNNCQGNNNGINTVSTDGSGYTINTPSTGFGTPTTVISRSGRVIIPPVASTSGAANATDNNGNQITVNTSGQFFDTLSSTTPVLTVAGSGTPASPTTFTYTPPPGGSAAYTMKYAAYTVQTKFGCGAADYGPIANNLVSEIDLPDNSKYTFTYEPTPGVSGNVTGRLASVTLPTGGTITYTYTGGSTGHITCADGSASGLTRVTPDGTWTYARAAGTGAAYTTTVADPQSNNTKIQFQGIYETLRQVYQGAVSPANLLRSWNTCYNGSASPCTATAITLPISRRTVIDQYGSSGLECKHDYFYNAFGLPTEQDDYDYGTAPGALLRKQIIVYNTSLTNNIVSAPSTITSCSPTGTASACNGTGTVVAQTSFTYDQGTPTATTGTPQHAAITGSRGNRTTITSFVNSSTTLHKTIAYFDTGNVQTATDVNGGQTTSTYSNATASCGNSFPTGVNEPLSMTRSFAWNCTGGVMTSVTDENSKITSFTYSDPDFWRPASVNFPDGGQVAWTYNSPTSTTTTTKIDSSQNRVETVTLDSLGRLSRDQLSFDSTFTATSYDALGRVYAVYNPTRCNPPTTYCGESTWGYTAYSYDALNRVTTIRAQDATTSGVSYSNNTATFTDQAGKARKVQYDSIGRLTAAWEDPSGVNFETDYSYDALANLTCVAQKGTNSGTFSNCASTPASWRPRTFASDGLSRLTSSQTPESGTTTYNYNSNGDLSTRVAPLHNQTGSSTVTTTYGFDLLHRPTAKIYSDSTPTVTFTYDSVSLSGLAAPQNPTGRLVYAATSNTGTTFSYDSMGRIAFSAQCTPLNCGSGWLGMSYTYDLNGDMTSYTNAGWGKTFTQGFDANGRFYNLSTNWVDSTHPSGLAAADWRVRSPYYPSGLLGSILLWNNLEQTYALDNRLQPCRANVNSSNTMLANCVDTIPSGNVLDLNAGFNYGSSDNGNVASLVATGNQTFNRSYTYDSLNRLSGMTDSATSQLCKGLSWTYDAWGNRNAQSATAGTCPTFSNTAGNSNQLGAAYQYDTAGNLTADGSHTYFYDAEGRLTQVDGTAGNCSTATACYVYDALGRRSRKIVGSSYLGDYFYNANGQLDSLVENTHSSRGYVYVNGRLTVVYANNNTYFVHPDHLASTRLLTNYPTPTVAESDDYSPFGESTTGASTGTFKFTGDEYDSETGLHHTLFRQYSSSLGRWTSPDPAGRRAASLSNPQTWNRYAYVTNNPMSLVDPLGLDPCNPDAPDSQAPVDAIRIVGAGRHSFKLGHRPRAMADDCGGDSGGGGGGGGVAGPGPLSDPPLQDPVVFTDQSTIPLDASNLTPVNVDGSTFFIVGPNLVAPGVLDSVSAQQYLNAISLGGALAEPGVNAGLVVPLVGTAAVGCATIGFSPCMATAGLVGIGGEQFNPELNPELGPPNVHNPGEQEPNGGFLGPEPAPISGPPPPGPNM